MWEPNYGEDKIFAGPEVTTNGLKAGTTSRVPPHLFAVLMLGIVSQVGQVLLLRELLMVFHGNELSIGIILASWMVWVGVGSRLGVVFIEKINRPLSLLMSSAVGLLLVLPATIMLIRFLRGVFEIPPGAYLSLVDMASSCFLIMAPACLLLGAQFVFLARVWRDIDQSVDSSGTGKTYICGAAGNMLGGLLFTFLLVHYLNAFQIACLVGMLMLAAAWYSMRRIHCAGFFPSRWSFTIIALLILYFIAFPFLEDLDQWAYRMQWQYFMPDHELVETRQSEHGAISVVRRADQYTFFQSGHLIFSTAGPKAVAPGFEEQEAVELAHLAMVQHKQPERVLLIGGGLRGLLSEIVKHPVEAVDYIELDEALTDVARPYITSATLEALDDPRVSLIHTDGRLFVKTAGEQYDMIIVDIPDPATAVLNRYYTREFFSEANDLLYDGGVLAIGAVSTPDLRGTAVANRNATLYHTLNSEFERVLPAGERVMSFFASNEPGQISLDIKTLQDRYTRRDIEIEGFSAHHYQAMLEEGQLRRVNWTVRNHGRSSRAHLDGPTAAPLSPDSLAEQEAAEKELLPVEEQYFMNSDFKPIGYYYTLMFWDQLTRPEDDKTFMALLHVQPWWILPLCFITLLTVLGLRISSGRAYKRSRVYQKYGDEQRPDTNFGVLCTIFTTGLSTMALQVALLFSFQSIYGFVYEMVGLIMAMFMSGLALGAYLTNRFVKNKVNLNLLAGVQLFIALLAVLIAVVLPRAALVESPAVIFMLFSLLTFSAGLINGVDFPLSLACYMALNKNAEKTAGTVYGLELFGACIGAVLASAVIVPVLGIIACCLFASIANFTAFVVILISRRDVRWLERTHHRTG